MHRLKSVQHNNKSCGKLLNCMITISSQSRGLRVDHVSVNPLETLIIRKSCHRNDKGQCSVIHANTQPQARLWALLSMANAPASHMRYPSAYYWPCGYASKCQRNRMQRTIWHELWNGLCWSGTCATHWCKSCPRVREYCLLSINGTCASVLRMGWRGRDVEFL